MGQPKQLTWIKLEVSFLFLEITNPAPVSPWNITQFTVLFGVSIMLPALQCSWPLLYYPGLTALQAPPRGCHEGREMFAWPTLKNLSRFEINKQNLKNVIHGSKTKTKLNLKKKKRKGKKSLVFPRDISPGKGCKKVNKQSHFILTSGTEEQN